MTKGRDEVNFHGPVLAHNQAIVQRLRAYEGLHRCYEYEFWFSLPHAWALGPDERDILLSEPCKLSFGLEDEHSVHGILRELDVLPSAATGENDLLHYRAILVPRMWAATQTERSRLFHNLAPQRIIAQLAREQNLEERRDFVLRLREDAPRREYIVQYRESDWNFACRLAETQGLFFFFEQSSGFELFVVADENRDCSPAYPHPIRYDDHGAHDGSTHAVTSIGHRSRRGPRTVLLQDYNYRSPGSVLLAQAQVHPKGEGVVASYGEHFKDLHEGRRLARFRAEELAWQREVYYGSSRLPGFHPGRTFVLEGHPQSDFDRAYLITEVSHFSEQPTHTNTHPGASENTFPQGGYRNDFTAIPLERPYRALRATPRPSVSGIMHGRIAGERDQLRAPVDSHGRYQVILPFDVARSQEQPPSRWIRMAQTLSGPSYGMHFPLHVGVEVLLSHLDGDPDRPVIVGSVPNPESASPVNAFNATQSVIRTRAGIVIEFEDNAREHSLPEESER